MELKTRDKLKNTAKDLFNKKDYKYICTFLDQYKYHSIMEIIESNIAIEYKNCIPEHMSDRYCDLLDFKIDISKYDIDDWQIENYYLEKSSDNFDYMF